MKWFVIITIAYMLFSRLDDMIELAKSKNPLYQKEMEQQHREEKQERQEIAANLKEWISLECLIKSEAFYYMSKDLSDNAYEVNVKILQVEDNWIEVLTLKKKRNKRFFIKTEDISSVSRIL